MWFGSWLVGALLVATAICLLTSGGLPITVVAGLPVASPPSGTPSFETVENSGSLPLSRSTLSRGDDLTLFGTDLVCSLDALQTTAGAGMLLLLDARTVLIS